MKKVSLLTTIIFVLGFITCLSCGYLLSTAIISSSLFQYTSVINFEQQTVYAISVANSNQQESLLSQQNSLQSKNGAGYIYQMDQTYHLIASIYENINDAELVKNNLKTSGIDCEIKTISLQSKQIEGNFSSDEKSVLTTCAKSKFDIFKKLYDVSISLDTCLIDEKQAKLECNSIYSTNISNKANFDTYFSSQINNSSLKELNNDLERTNTMLFELITESFDNNKQTLSSLIKETYCKILLE